MQGRIREKCMNDFLSLCAMLFVGWVVVSLFISIFKN